MSLKFKHQHIENCVKIINDFFDEISEEYHKIGTLPELVDDHFEEMTSHIKMFVDDLTEQIRKQRVTLESELETVYKRYLELVESLSEDVIVEKDLMPLLKMIGYLKTEVKKLEGRYQQVLNQVKRLNSEMISLCDSLGIEAKKLTINPLPTKEQMDEFKQEFENLQNRKYSLLEELINKKDTLQKLANELNYKPETEIEKHLIFVNERSFILSQDNLDQLDSLLRKLDQKMIEDKQYLETLQIQLKILWKCLDSSEEEKVDELQRSCQDMLLCQKIDVHINEIEKCEKIKKENSKKYLHELRSRILDYWLKCSYGDKQRKEFQPFYFSDIDDHILKLHEEQIIFLINYYEKNKEIFETFNKWYDYWEKFIKLNDMTTNTVSRYQNRGCTLLQEERQRNLVDKKLQFFEDKLTKQAKQFEEDNKRPLIIHDMDILELIRSKIDEFKAEKENRLLQKKLQRMATNTTLSTTHSATQQSKFSTPQQRVLRPHLITNCPKTPASQKCIRKPESKLLINTPKSVDSKLTKFQKLKKLNIPKRKLVPVLASDGNTLLHKGKRLSGTFDSKMKKIRRSKNRNSLLEYSKFLENMNSKKMENLNSTRESEMENVLGTE